MAIPDTIAASTITIVKSSIYYNSFLLVLRTIAIIDSAIMQINASPAVAAHIFRLAGAYISVPTVYTRYAIVYPIESCSAMPPQSHLALFISALIAPIAAKHGGE